MRPLPITRRFRLPDQADLERQQAQVARAEEDDALNRALNDIAAISKCWSVMGPEDARAASLPWRRRFAMKAVRMRRLTPAHWLNLAIRVRRASRRPGLSKRRREYGEDLADALARIAVVRVSPATGRAKP